jgi:hypothetical protein
MTDDDASEMLRAKGYRLGYADGTEGFGGRLQFLVYREGEGDTFVESGEELLDLAEGRLTLQDIRRRRQAEQTEG